ncbi:alpha/beta hydrolase [Lysobacter firmicutimachus]|uniref:Alpha/beta hydrolase n=1 Tax=Lysobacter firmicutimachus TaxID=1792846 RepID=A0AAU8MQE5_9GAMM
MKTQALLASLLLALSPFASAAPECKDTSSYAEARAIIEDLGRIVAPNGIQESYAARIGGIDQWLSVRGQDKNNPILLFVHGGPASPVIPTSWQFQRPIEEYFTVVNWDQRGAGKTYALQDPQSYADTIHIDRFADDVVEVAQYLRQRYGKRKIVLMAHSWGTIISMKAALKQPDLFYAYVGIGQAINVRDNERISFDFGLQRAKALGNAEAVKEMEAIMPYPGDQPITRERIIAARKWSQYYGGLTAYRNDSTYFYRGPRLSPEYGDCDRRNVNEGNVFTLGKILPEFVAVDYKPVREFPIPVVFFLGRHDYTTPAEPAEQWLKQVKAPFKQGVWFENSSHMMPWEEPGKTLTSLLQYVRPLAVDPATAAH